MRQPLSIWCKINGQMYRCYSNQERGKTLENFTNPISHNTWFSGIMKICLNYSCMISIVLSYLFGEKGHLEFVSQHTNCVKCI